MQLLLWIFYNATSGYSIPSRARALPVGKLNRFFSSYGQIQISAVKYLFVDCASCIDLIVLGIEGRRVEDVDGML